jgi:hypothetical protein
MNSIGFVNVKTYDSIGSRAQEMFVAQTFIIAADKLKSNYRPITNRLRWSLHGIWCGLKRLFWTSSALSLEVASLHALVCFNPPWSSVATRVGIYEILKCYCLITVFLLLSWFALLLQYYSVQLFTDSILLALIQFKNRARVQSSKH